MIATLTIIETVADYTQEITVSLEEDLFALEFDDQEGMDKFKDGFFDNLVTLGKKAMKDAMTPEPEPMDIRCGAPGEEEKTLELGWYNPIHGEEPRKQRMDKGLVHSSVYLFEIHLKEARFRYGGNEMFLPLRQFLQLYEYSEKQD